METKDDDAIQMIEDSIEGIKGLDGYKEMTERVLEESRQVGPKGVHDAMVELVGNNEVSNKRLDHMNDLMRIMRLEMDKREMGEARRVSDAVEQVGKIGECMQKHYKDHYGSDGSDKRVKFTFSNNT